MSSFRSISVDGYRGLVDVALEDLTRLNLVTGLNGSGKSSLLEAILMLSAPERPELVMGALVLRSIAGITVYEGELQPTPWDTLFNVFHTEKKAHLRATTRNGGKYYIELTLSERKASPERMLQRSIVSNKDAVRGRALQWKFATGSSKTGHVRTLSAAPGENALRVDPPSGQILFNAVLQAPSAAIQPANLATRISTMDIAGKMATLVESLAAFDPRVCDVRVLVTGGVPFPHVELNSGHLLPITLMGNGFAHTAETIVNLHESSGGIALFDEADAGLHPAAMAGVWRAIAVAANRFDVQVIASTHSLDFIEAAQQLPAEHSKELSLYRLDRDDESGRSVSYKYSAAEFAEALAAGLDVR